MSIVGLSGLQTIVIGATDSADGASVRSTITADIGSEFLCSSLITETGGTGCFTGILRQECLGTPHRDPVEGSGVLLTETRSGCMGILLTGIFLIGVLQMFYLAVSVYSIYREVASPFSVLYHNKIKYCFNVQ